MWRAGPGLASMLHPRSRLGVENSSRGHLRRAAAAVRDNPMATNPASRPKGRSIKSLRTVWGFALHYPGHIAVAALALLVAAGWRGRRAR